MNSFYNQLVDQIKAEYPAGTRILVLNMVDNFHPIPSGTKGTVKHVDDAGQIHCLYDNGRSGLALVPGIDSFRKLTCAELGEEGRPS